MVKSNHTWVCSVGRSEGIIHKYISKFWELCSKLFDLFRFALDFFTFWIFYRPFLFMVISYILAKENVSIRFRDSAQDIFTNTVVQKMHSPSQHLF